MKEYFRSLCSRDFEAEKSAQPSQLREREVALTVIVNPSADDLEELFEE